MFTQQIVSKLQLPLVLFLCLTASGCYFRPARVPVSGRVTLDGEPVPFGHIRFVPGDARAAFGEIENDGHFRLTTFDSGDGCVLGTHKVEVIARHPQGETSIRHLVPPKYGTAETSDISVEITGPTSDLEVKLVSNGWKPFTENSVTGGDADPSKIE